MKIWRYVDLAKFVHMLATGTLYFPCPTTELKDPYEGSLPRSHIEAEMQIVRGILDELKTTLDSIAALHPTRDRAPLDHVLEEAQRKLNVQKLRREATDNFGVSCWHINEHESEAMWQLYTAAGQGIAIESTKAKLESALRGEGIIVDQVRYMDFDADEIKKSVMLSQHAIKRSKTISRAANHPRPGGIHLVQNAKPRQTSNRISNAIPLGAAAFLFRLDQFIAGGAAEGIVMSGRCALIRGNFRRCAGRGCGHVFGLLRGEWSPPALMLFADPLPRSEQRA